MIGFTERTVPIAARAAERRPPLRRYSRVSTATNRSTSGRRSRIAAAISAAAAPAAAISAAIRAGIPVDIDVDPVSMTWISRSGSAWAARVALWNVAESFVPIVGQTIASAPSAKHASNVSRNVPGEGAAVVGNGASGASIRAQNCVLTILAVRSAYANAASISKASMRPPKCIGAWKPVRILFQFLLPSAAR